MSSSEDDDSKVNIIPMDSFPSDGDMSTWPGGQYAERDDHRWRQLLAENWLKNMGTFEEGRFLNSKCFSLIFLSTWKRAFTESVVHSVPGRPCMCCFCKCCLSMACLLNPVHASKHGFITSYFNSWTDEAYKRCHSYPR